MDVTRPLPEKIKLCDPKGKKCCQLGHTCKDQRKLRQDEVRKNVEGKQKQEWRKVRALDPKVDKTNAQGRFNEQLEEEATIQNSNSEVETQWQIARGRPATKKHTDMIREKEVDIGNAFKALVDTDQKIVQLSEAQALIAIIEHRVKQSNVESVLRKALKNCKWVDNYDEAPGGRIWVAWDSTLVDYTMTRHHEQFILGKVTILQQNVQFHLCAVYGKHTVQDRKNLWKEMLISVVNLRSPCLIMEDFNTILTSEDRFNGSPVQKMETREFKQFLVDAKVDELKTVGRQYTWTNNHVYSRIDRILINAKWMA
ncbi:PREDICTED: uncharacterized protein LOC109236105 [Nicotiana attenuata]|uniref:uncharacterized protein LOC109236105 n=1 Tax=Nicotiana attenuata TaxID=49451 RepID=UPI0009048482|nr:PREDICTED: uncharacterized protein LOC109236105 [Nicotiana attenuata]